MGYADSQIPTRNLFIQGKPNLKPGTQGSAAAEMDLWESNKYASTFTAHPCYSTNAVVCNGDSECGIGSKRYEAVCDMDGNLFHSF